MKIEAAPLSPIFPAAGEKKVRTVIPESMAIQWKSEGDIWLIPKGGG